MEEIKEKNVIAKEVADIKIKDLDLPNATKNIIIRHVYVETLGDLLNVDYDKIKRARTMGEYHLQLIKDYVHKLGYTLKGEYPSIDETKATLKANGFNLLEDYGFSPKVCGPLYRSGIFTLDDLKNYDHDVLEIVGLGPVRKHELIEKMKEFGIEIKKETLPQINEEELVKTEEDIEQIAYENESIKKRIETKVNLVAEYYKLYQERQELIKKEKELDALLEEIIEAKGNGVLNGR